jgi:RimJ/RimL family protein N-acetyltransferase
MGQRVRIVHLSEPVLAALAAGDLVAAEAVSPVPLSEYLVGPECLGTWKRRHDQVARDPAEAGWVTGVIWDEERQIAVGRAGFHARPDAAGLVGIGYAVDPAYRRRGYARAAFEALLARAAADPLVHRVRVTIRPDNVASYGLVARYGFTEVGEQWDDEDGLEIIYEIDAQVFTPPAGMVAA